MKVGGKSVPDSLRFSKYVLESRRKSARHGNRAYGDGLIIVGKKDINLPILRQLDVICGNRMKS